MTCHGNQCWRKFKPSNGKSPPPKGVKPPDKRKENVAKTSASTANLASTSANLRSKLHDKVKHKAALVHEITEELQAIEEES